MKDQFQNDINRETLKELRVGLGLIQEELAYKVGVDKVTYHRWEKGGTEIRLKNQKNLAKALGVSLEKLRQPSSRDMPAKEQKSKGLKLTPKTITALEVVADTYHVSPRDVIDLAPYLFHIIAGASLGARKQKTDEAASALAHALKFAEDALPHMSSAFGMTVNNLQEGELYEEIEAINNQQLFNVEFAYSNDENVTVKNPFTNFLQPLVDQVPDQLNNLFEVEWTNDGLPITRLTDACLSELTRLPLGNELFERVKDLINNGKLSRHYFLRYKGMEQFIANHMDAYMEGLREDISKIEAKESNQ